MFKKNRDYDLDLEKVVLGLFILDRHAYGSCRHVVTEDCFYDDSHRLVFKEIAEYWEEGGMIDLITIKCRMCAKGMEEINGYNTAYYLTGLTMDVVQSAHLEAWCFILREFHARRVAIEATKNIDMSGDPFEIAQQIKEKVDKALEVRSSNDWLNTGDITLQLIENLTTPKGEMIGLTTGSRVIDSMNGGFKPGNLIILAARPGMGKSAYMGKIAMDIVRQARKVGIISLEMPAVDVFARMVAAATGVAHWKIDRGQMYDKSESEAVHAKINSFSSLPLFFSDTAKSSAFDIRAKAEKLQRKNGLDILFIDYLQLIESEGKKNKNRENEVSEISRGMKLLAMDLKIPVVCLAQLNREAAKGKPELHHLRESGSLEQDADVVIFIHREWEAGNQTNAHGESTENEADILVRKWRNGRGYMDVKMGWRGETMEFYDLDTTFDRPQPTSLPSATLTIDPTFDNTPF